MENYEEVIGIDVSKLTIDAHIYHTGAHMVFTNDKKGFLKLLKWVKGQLQDTSVFYCFENTGNYSLKLASFFSGHSIDYIEENPLAIKRSAGIVRGKTDKLDAAMIARYAWLHRAELVFKTVKDPILQELGRLLALRDQIVRNRTGLISSRKELLSLLSSCSTDCCFKAIERSIHYLTKQIAIIESRMKDLIKSEPALKRNSQLLLSIKGVGLILTCQLLCHTSNFERFKTWRQFSSYCGTAPFEYRSGTSIHKRNRCHYIGDRKMKTLLSLASISAIQHDCELKLYYKKKVIEGKPKMIALNNVRNKLLARVFSVIKRGTPYVVLNQHAA